MKYLCAVLMSLVMISGFSQKVETPKPQFFSVITMEEIIGDFRLVSNYYPLKSNIDNPGSVVFISETPALYDIENSAANLPSDFFYVSRNKVVLNKIMLLNKPVRNYYVVNPQTGDQNEYECNLKGDITENRANEIVAEKVDPNARIEGTKLYFNNKEFEIISTKDIREEVLALIDKYQLSKGLVKKQVK
jgi:hypothetical protein